MMPTETDIAWAAGLFEGEGAFFTKKGGDGSYLYPAATVGMTDEDVVLHFAEVVGVGKVYGPYKNRKCGRGCTEDQHEHKPFWQWTVSGAAGMAQVVTLLEPYLFSRRTARAQEVMAVKVGRA